MIKISIIIPVYNEAGNIQTLNRELKDILRKINRNYEIIYIDDSSNDTSLKKLESLAKIDKRIKVISFSRNFGQTAALSAGISLSKGAVIIPMDGDLQNDPADIPLLLNKIDEGYSVVSGWRKNRHDPFVRVLPSKIANWIIAKTTGVPIHDNGCSLKAYKRSVIEGVELYGEMHRFISVYATWSGGKVTEVVVNHRERIYGKSKYGFSRIFKVLLDLLVIRFLHSYINRPIHFFGKYGFYALTLGFCFELAAIVLKLWFNRSFIATPLPVLGTMFFIVGVQLILTGIVAELLMRTYYESQNKKPFHVNKTINCSRRKN